MSYQKAKSKSPKNKPNYLYSIVSVALVLFLLGLFGMIILHANLMVIYFKENIKVLVEIKDEARDAEVFQFQKMLEGSDFSKPGSVQYLSKEEAADQLKSEFGDDFMDYGISNPLYNSISFNVRAHYMHADTLRLIKQEIKQKIFINDVFYPVTEVENITRNIRRLGTFTLVLSLVFIFIAITLINNTIKLVLYSNRFLIKNMQLVGASWGFIRRPYIMKALVNGLISSFLAIILLIFFIYFLYKEFPELVNMSNSLTLIILFASIILLGVLISGFSTRMGINRYLKMRLEELY